MGNAVTSFPLPESAAGRQSNALGELLHKIRGSESPGEVAASKNLKRSCSPTRGDFGMKEKASKWFRAAPLIVDTRNALRGLKDEKIFRL